MADELHRAVVRYLLIAFITCCTCAAQSITVGASGGGLTDDVLTFPAPGLNGLNIGSAFRLESRFYDVGAWLISA
jgi:hypothetical protein